MFIPINSETKIRLFFSKSSQRLHRLSIPKHLLVFFLFQFNVPFKIISLILRQANRKVGRNRSTPGKPPDTPASRTWLVSHVASAGLKPTPDTAASRWDVPVGVPLDLSTLTGMTCIGTYGENCKSDNVSKYCVL